MSSEELLAGLKKVVRGLRYPSEKDAPITPFLWDEERAPTRVALLRRSGLDGATPCEVGKAEDFFAGLTQVQDWHGAREKVAARRFLRLRDFVAENLTGVKVYRLGKARKKLLLLGKTAAGEWAGLETEVLET